MMSGLLVYMMFSNLRTIRMMPALLYVCIMVSFVSRVSANRLCRPDPASVQLSEEALLLVFVLIVTIKCVLGL